MAIRDLFGALHEREFRLVFLARASSIVGDEVAPIALVFAILDLTHGSASALGAVLAARTAPFVIFLLVGGVWADRLPRQRVMFASDLGRCTTQGATAFLLISGPRTCGRSPPFKPSTVSRARSSNRRRPGSHPRP